MSDATAALDQERARAGHQPSDRWVCMLQRIETPCTKAEPHGDCEQAFVLDQMPPPSTDGTSTLDGEAEVRFDETTDAVLWAEAFQRTYRDLVHRGYTNPWEKPIDDEGWLLGWFANAIERGRSAGAAPFGGVGQAMTGYEVAEAMDAGRKLLIRFLSGGDVTWWLAGDKTDDYPEGTPSSWYRENIGQINIVVQDVTGAPEFDGVVRFTPCSAEGYPCGRDECQQNGCLNERIKKHHPLIENVSIRNIANDGP